MTRKPRARPRRALPPWRRSHLAALALLVAGLAASDVVWLRHDTRPPRWDESVHLLAAERIRQSPPGQELAVAMQETFYPPFVPLVGAAVAPVTGPAVDRYGARMRVFLA